MTKAEPHPAEPPAATCPTVLRFLRSPTPRLTEMVICANIFMREEHACRVTCLPQDHHPSLSQFSVTAVSSHPLSDMLSGVKYHLTFHPAHIS